VNSGRDGNTIQCWMLSVKCWNSEVGMFLPTAWGIGDGHPRASRFCPGDGIVPTKVLRYGRTVRRGAATCTSRKRGMTCKYRGRHGFFLSRHAQRMF
jgi:hypothetical protein